MKETNKPLLFQKFPELIQHLSWISFTSLPTPVERLTHIEKILDVRSLWVKRDDLSGQVYGGNKPRKLEFLLAKALKKGAKRVMTFGALGSHHTLATTIYARELDLQVSLTLVEHPLDDMGRNNLILSHSLGAESLFAKNDLGAFWGSLINLFHIYKKDGQLPFIIPPGGTSPLGCLGYVNAALELAKQIKDNQCAKPDRIFVSMGTMGTMAGLILGFILADIDIKVVGVKISHDPFTSALGVSLLVWWTSHLLHLYSPQCKIIKIAPSQLDIRRDFLGDGYSHPTPEGLDAIQQMQENEGITLEHTYTGKTFAALIDAAHKKELHDQDILFWNTYNSAPPQKSLSSNTKCS